MTEPGPTARRGETLSDRALVDAARSGDRQALEDLLRRHHDRLHLLCRRLCRDLSDAEDATQNAMIAIVRGLDRYDGRAEFSTWAYRVATNACMDELRRRARRPTPVQLEHDDTDAAVGPGRSVRANARIGHDPIDPAEFVVRSEQQGRLQLALEALEESFRVPVVLRDVADMDYAEIGELLGLPPGTVRSRISRGRAKLASILDIGNQSGSDTVRTEDP